MRRNLHFILFCIAIVFSVTTNARTVTYNGTGVYNNNANWVNGLMPLAGVIDTIIITGNIHCYCDISLEEKELLIVKPGFSITLNDGPDSWLAAYKATITIEQGGTFNNWTSNKVNFDRLNIDGTYRSGWVVDPGLDSIIVNGTFESLGFLVSLSNPVIINNGGVFKVGLTSNFSSYRLTVNDGGTLINEGSYNIAGPLTVKNAGTFHNKTTGKIKNGDKLIVETGGIFINEGNYSGTGTYEGNFTNSGVLAPGSSPGVITLTGNYSPTSTATHNFEVGGTATSQYDILNVSGTVHLNGALNVSLINGFTPSTNHELPIITGTINGTFSTVNIPSSYILVYNANSVVLKSAIVLPVNFKNINVTKSNNYIRVHWSIDNERDVIRYEVEKSSDGSLFAYIGSVPANNQTEYYYNDAITDGKKYYRIKSISKDGTNKFSNISRYDNGRSSLGLKAISLNNKLVLQHATANKNSFFSISTIDGKQLKTLAPKQGLQQTEIDISHLSIGIYLISFNNSGRIESLRFLKQ